MAKYFLKNLLKIIGGIFISFLIIISILLLLLLCYNFPIPTIIIVFSATILLAAYSGAKKECAKEKETTRHIAWSLISDEYDKLLDACRNSDISGEWQSAKECLSQFQNLLIVYKKEHGEDSTYVSFMSRLEKLLQHYPTLVDGGNQ